MNHPIYRKLEIRGPVISAIEKEQCISPLKAVSAAITLPYLHHGENDTSQKRLAPK